MIAPRRQDVAPRAPRAGVAASAPAVAAEPQAGAATRLLLLALALTLPVAAVAGAWRVLTTTRAFAVSTVTFTGTVNASKDELAALTGALSRNALALDLDDVRRRLLRSPWIEEASVRRALPHELRVTVVEREPEALEAAPSGLRVLDAQGRDLGAAEPGRFALPEIRGVEARPKPGRAAARALAAATLAALRRASPELHGRAEALDASEGDKLVLLAKDCPPLWLSGPESADEAAAWARRRNGIGQAVGRAAWVDARWRDRLYVMPARS